MTEKLNTLIRIPVWLLSIISVLFIAYMGFYTAQLQAQNATQTKVEKLEKDIEKKADKETVTTMQQDIREIRKSTDDIKNLLLAK
jgi:Tfp pilus assembly protein PilO